MAKQKLKSVLIPLFTLTIVATGIGASKAQDPSTHLRTIAAQSAPAKRTLGSIYFDTETQADESQARLLLAAAGKVTLSAAEASALIDAYSQSEAHSRIIENYATELLRILGIDPEDPSKWISANSKLHRGVINYTGESNESMHDEEGPSWQSINHKLRAKKTLTKIEQTFFDEIQFSVMQLPQVKGLVFRGQAMTPEQFAGVQEGKPWPQPAFTSTSLAYSVASSFGRGHPGHSKTGVLIIKAKNGAPVSVLTFDHGYMGQPGRISEHEILIRAGESLFVHKKIDDVENERYLIFAEQL